MEPMELLNNPNSQGNTFAQGRELLKNYITNESPGRGSHLPEHPNRETIVNWETIVSLLNPRNGNKRNMMIKLGLMTT
jgi:hypothetical protein